MNKTLYSTQWIRLLENDNNIPFVEMDDGVLVVPMRDGENVILLNEYSVAYEQNILFVTGGTVEPGEPHEQTANRELQEEIGYKAARLDYLGELRPMIKYMRCHLFVYLARDLQGSQLEGDEPWPMVAEPVALSEIESLIASGRLLDANAIAALYMARTFLQNGG